MSLSYRQASVVRMCVCVNISNILSETTEPVEAKFHMEPPWDGGTKVSSHDQDSHGKNLKKIIFSGTKRPMTLKLGMQHRVLKYYQVCSNGDPGLTMTSFTARSNLVPYAAIQHTKCFCMEKR